jgi:transposase
VVELPRRVQAGRVVAHIEGVQRPWSRPPVVFWFRTSRTGVSRHAGLVSPEIPDRAVAGIEPAAMALTRLLITAVVVENRPVREVAAAYGVSKSWLYQVLARYRAEGDAAFEPRSRRPKTSPTAVPEEVVDLIVELREKLTTAGMDAGPDTIAWHLAHQHGITVSRASVARHLVKNGLVVPEPRKRPKSSYTRFDAEQPNECWQADFTHYRLTRRDGRPGADSEILSWLDDCSRFALSVTAHHRVTGPIVLAEFRTTVAAHGIPASTLTDNGTVFTTRLSGGNRGAETRNGFEHELRKLGVTQKNSRPNHPTTSRVGRTVPADPQEVAGRAAEPADHDRRTADAARRLRRRVQPPTAAQLPRAPSYPGHRLHQPPQSHPRRPQR